MSVKSFENVCVCVCVKHVKSEPKQHMVIKPELNGNVYQLEAFTVRTAQSTVFSTWKGFSKLPKTPLFVDRIPK